MEIFIQTWINYWNWSSGKKLEIFTGSIICTRYVKPRKQRWKKRFEKKRWKPLASVNHRPFVSITRDSLVDKLATGRRKVPDKTTCSKALASCLSFKLRLVGGVVVSWEVVRGVVFCALRREALPSRCFSPPTVKGELLGQYDEIMESSGLALLPFHATSILFRLSQLNRSRFQFVRREVVGRKSCAQDSDLPATVKIESCVISVRG